MWTITCHSDNDKIAITCGFIRLCNSASLSSSRAHHRSYLSGTFMQQRFNREMITSFLFVPLFRDPLQIYKFLLLIYHSYSLFSIYFLLEQFPLTMGKTFYIKLLTSQQIESKFELSKHIISKNK